MVVIRELAEGEELSRVSSLTTQGSSSVDLEEVRRSLDGVVKRATELLSKQARDYCSFGEKN